MTNQPVNIDDVLDSFDELWAPRILAQVNDWDVRLVKVKGKYVWHTHPETDELFVILDGTLEIRIRDADGVESSVQLGKHDTYTVPRGTEHRPISPDGAVAMLFEPTGTLNTGDYDGEIPDHITSTTGIAAD